MNKKTKIVATIGPASDNKETLEKLVKAGMNVVRINFSHGTHESNGKVIDIVREISQEINVPVGIIADLQGPRIRTVVDEDVDMIRGESIGVYDISFDKSKIEIQKCIGLDVPGIINDIEIGNEILIEDGLKRIKITERRDNILIGEVIAGGIVKNHKGVNIPDAKLKIPAVTEKDEEDMAFALKKEVDFVALSFVSNAREIEETRQKMKKMLGRDFDIPQIISKIERKEAIKNIDELVKASDVIMVARGDLGIEMDESKVVIYQKEIISKCLSQVRPVIVATQMLDSMINNPIPTRAEVADVSNAVIDHTDATMLSGESASGKYPVEAVAMMAKIIADTEESSFDDYVPSHIEIENHRDSEYRGVIASAWKMAKSTEAKGILSTTVSGTTAKLISNYRMEKINMTGTNSFKVYNQLAIVWGVEPYHFGKKERTKKMVDLMIKIAKEEGRFQKKDKVVEVINDETDEEKILMVGLKEVK
jgi:pyruvate kinase